MNGLVKTYNRRTGYGFIMDAEGKEYFVHRNILKKRLHSGQRVFFDGDMGPNGLYVKNVEVENVMEVGRWIDYEDSILEVVEITETDIIGREVLINKSSPKLKYGDTIVISRTMVEPIKNPA